jgi:hypothetical protein
MLRLFSAVDHIIEHARVWQDRVPQVVSGGCASGDRGGWTRVLESLPGCAVKRWD